MAITGFTPVFEVNDTEYGYNIEKFAPVNAGEPIKMFVPKIMGIRSKGVITVRGSGMFDNEVKPPFGSSITKIDYVTVLRRDNCYWDDKLDSTGMIPKDTKFIVEFVNGDISLRYVTTK